MNYFTNGAPYIPGHPEGEAVRWPCGLEEDAVVRASHWRGRLEGAIEEELMRDKTVYAYVQTGCGSGISLVSQFHGQRTMSRIHT